MLSTFLHHPQITPKSQDREDCTGSESSQEVITQLWMTDDKQV